MANKVKTSITYPPQLHQNIKIDAIKVGARRGKPLAANELVVEILRYFYSLEEEDRDAILGFVSGPEDAIESSL